MIQPADRKCDIYDLVCLYDNKISKNDYLAASIINTI